MKTQHIHTQRQTPTTPHYHHTDISFKLSGANLLLLLLLLNY